MKNKWKKAVLILSGSLLLSGCAQDTGEISGNESRNTAEPVPSAETDVTLETGDVGIPEKQEERVQIKADAYGNPLSQSVEVTLYPGDSRKNMHDVTFLTDVMNTSGDEEYERISDTDLIWENNGNAVTYKGTPDKTAPVSVSVSYELDGKHITPSELAGASGHLKIRFDYRNETAQDHTIVPMAALTMIVLSPDVFAGVKGENLKVISTGDTMIAAGIAFPGWRQALNTDAYELTEDMDLPEHVTLEADVRNFELDFTATVFTNGLFREMEEDDLNDIDDLIDGMTKLSDALSELSSGAGELYDGMSTFGGYLNTLNEGIGSLKDGTAQLADGTGQLYEQSEALETGSAALAQGLKGLNDALAKLDPEELMKDLDPETQKAVKEALEKLAADARDMETSLQIITEDKEALQAYLNSLQAYQAVLQEKTAALIQSAEQMDFEQTGMHAAQLQNDIAQVSEGIMRREDLSEEEKEQLQALIASSSDVLNDLGSFMKMAGDIQAMVQTMNSLEMPEGIDADTVKNTVDDALIQLGVLISAMQNTDSLPMVNLQDLADQAAEMKKGIGQLADGSAQLSEGIVMFRKGILTLNEGTGKLDEGVGTLQEGSGALNEGYGQLCEGMKAMSDGIAEFEREGISEIRKLGENELGGLLSAFRRMRRRDAEYRSFSGITEGTEGSTVFIIETERIR